MRQIFRVFRNTTPRLSRRSSASLLAVGLLFISGSLASCSKSPQKIDQSPVDQGNASSKDKELEEKVLAIIKENPEVILDAVQTYQQQQRENQRKAQESFLKGIKTNPRSVIGDSPTKGAKDVKIVLVEFSDFQCPYCASAHAALNEFMAKRGDRVTMVYKHFPLTSIHPEAVPAAKASWAAGKQGKFWEYHDALFQNQARLGDALYVELAKTLNLDVGKFDRDRSGQAADTAIQQDLKLAKDLGLPGTPFIVMNGEVVEVGPQLVESLEAMLAQVK